MMNRSFWIKAHLLTAAFFTPALLLIALSGGLYLLGIKGKVVQTPIAVPADAAINAQSPTLDQDVRALLQSLGLPAAFEYVKVSGNTLYTRPTSQPHFELRLQPEGLRLLLNKPSLQKSLIELHKGHGPLMFKDFQKAMAAALLFILASGTWLGLSALGLRRLTAVTTGAGLIVLLALILAP